MRVIKFGGTSLANKEAIEKVLSIIKNKVNNEEVIIVVSALSGVTDQLYKMTKLSSSRESQYLYLLNNIKARHFKLIDAFLSNSLHSKTKHQLENIFSELEKTLLLKVNSQNDYKKKLDYIAGFGERLSAKLITAFLSNLDIDARYTDTRSLIKTDDNFGSAVIIEDLTYKNIKNYYHDNSGSLIVATGFISSTIEGTPTTLGRGGSDYTASIFGAATQANGIEIWTDVDGLMTADPKKVETASLIGKVTYETAKHMSLFGAKVIYPPTIEPAMRFKIPIYIKNTFNSDSDGTIIDNNSSINYIKKFCISSAPGFSLITVQGNEIDRIENYLLNNIFLNDKMGITFSMHSKSNNQIRLALTSRNQSLTISKIVELIDDELSGIITNYSLLHNLNKITVVHENYSRLFDDSFVNYFSGVSKFRVHAFIYDKTSNSLSIFSDKKDEIEILNSTHNLLNSIDETSEEEVSLFNEKLFDYPFTQ